ncbi:MAG TPA: polyamine aminopropyltransferase, partial [Candidatus Nitrosotenuis sp.]|nr:polyamine aminopropyltransferase [Candidatus Nitrosotenuis sp.]
GAAAVQCTSPLFARRSFWCIVNTQRSAGLPARPYHAYVPSFGEWGFTLCATGEPRRPLPSGLRFLTPEVARSLFTFSPDMEALPARVNRLYDQALVRYYEADWRALSQ